MSGFGVGEIRCHVTVEVFPVDGNPGCVSVSVISLHWIHDIRSYVTLNPSAMSDRGCDPSIGAKTNSAASLHRQALLGEATGSKPVGRQLRRGEAKPREGQQAAVAACCASGKPLLAGKRDDSGAGREGRGFTHGRGSRTVFRCGGRRTGSPAPMTFCLVMWLGWISLANLRTAVLGSSYVWGST